MTLPDLLQHLKRKVQEEHFSGIIQLQAGQFADSLKTIDQRCAVNMQRACCEHLVVVTVKQRFKGDDVVRIVRSVMRLKEQSGRVKDFIRFSVCAAQPKQVIKANGNKKHNTLAAQGERAPDLRAGASDHAACFVIFCKFMEAVCRNDRPLFICKEWGISAISGVSGSYCPLNVHKNEGECTRQT